MMGNVYGQNLRDQRNEFGENLLHTCPTVAAAINLISQGVDVNARNTGGQAPIHRQMRQGHRDIVIYLLHQNLQRIDPNAQEADGTAPLHLAQDPEVNAALLAHPDINPNIKTYEWVTPLMSAAMLTKDIQIVEALLARPDVLLFESDKNGHTAIDYAAAKANTPAGVAVYNAIKAAVDFKALHGNAYTAPFNAAYTRPTGATPFSTMAQTANANINRLPPNQSKSRCANQ